MKSDIYFHATSRYILLSDNDYCCCSLKLPSCMLAYLYNSSSESCSHVSMQEALNRGECCAAGLKLVLCCRQA